MHRNIGEKERETERERENSKTLFLRFEFRSIWTFLRTSHC